MKTVSADNSYIDYTTELFGVRVRQTSCRTIALNGSEWAEYGNELTLPVTEPTLDPLVSEDLGDLVVNVVDYEACEDGDVQEARYQLRAVLLGRISVGDALSRSVPMRDLPTS
jgi:hypothetical protein